MRNLANFITGLLDVVEKLFYYIVCILLFVLLTVTVGGIIFDMVLAISVPWVEEVMILLFGWVIFLGAGLIMRCHGHVGIGAIVALTPRAVQTFFYFFSQVIVFLASIVMVYYGTKLTIFSGARQTSLYLDIPFYYFYAAVPIGGFLLAIFNIESFFKYDYGVTQMYVVLDE